MATTELEIKIGVEAQLTQLRAMEGQFARQIVQLRALGDTGSEALRTLERNLGSVRRELGNVGTMDKFRSALGDAVRDIPVVGVAMGSLNGSALPTAAVFGAATYAMTQFRASLNFADQLQDAAEQMDVSASSLQTLNAHFGDGGVRAEQVSQLMLKLRQSMAQAAAGSEPMSAAFAALNLNAEELRRLGPDEALARIGQALNEHGASASAAAAAQLILGEASGRALTGLRQLGEQGLAGTREAMVAAGRVIDDEMVKRLADANQALEELDQRWTVFKGTVAAGLLAPSRREQSQQAIAADDQRRAKELADLANPASAAEAEANRAELRRRLASAQTPLPGDAYARMTSEQAARADAALAAEAQQIQAALAALEVAESARRKRVEVTDAEARKPYTDAQTKAEAELVAIQTAQLDLATRIALAEDDRHRIRMQMPDAEDKSLEATKARAELTTQLVAAEATLVSLAREQAAEQAKAEAEAKRTAEQNERVAKTAREAQQLRASTAVAQLETERQLLAANGNLDPVVKARQLAELTERLKGAQEEVIKLKRIEVALAGNPLAKAQAEAELAAEEAKLKEMDKGTPPPPRTIESLRESYVQNTSDRTSRTALTVSEGPEAAALRQLNQFGSDGEIVARGVGQAFNGVFEGLRGSIQGLIEGTMTWGDALRNIGSSILSGVISAISEMFATWMAKRLLIFLFGEKLKAAESASTIAHEGATLPAKTAGAVASGISSYGFAIAGGLAAAALIASFAGAFADGGLIRGPGTGTSDSVFARVSNGEFVMREAAVRRFGVGFMEQVNAGRMPELAATSPAAAGGAGAGGGAAAAAPTVSNYFHFDANEAMRRALNDPAGRRLVTDLLRQLQHEV